MRRFSAWPQTFASTPYRPVAQKWRAPADGDRDQRSVQGSQYTDPAKYRTAVDATIKLDVTAMKDGDVAGLVALRHLSAYVGVKKSAGASKITMVDGLALNKSNWENTSTGTEAASAAFSGTTVWFRMALDVRNTGKTAKFSYSTDGSTFTSIGPVYALSTDWEFYPGYRYGIFNFATTALGGSVTLKSFEVTTP